MSFNAVCSGCECTAEMTNRHLNSAVKMLHSVYTVR